MSEYVPAPHKEIISCLRELLAWLHANQTITDIGIFHTILYAIHPFNNGNKRVARVQRELQFKTLFRHAQRKMAKQTFVTYLQQAANQGIVQRRQEGRAVYYRLDISLKEEHALDQLIDTIKSKLPYIPDSIKLA